MYCRRAGMYSYTVVLLDDDWWVGRVKKNGWVVAAFRSRSETVASSRAANYIMRAEWLQESSMPTKPFGQA